MTIIAYIIAMSALGQVPPSVSYATYAAAQRHHVDPVELGGYLISEHGDDWTPRPEQCSSAGACGPFQLSGTWPRAFGYRHAQRSEVLASADMAARMLAYTRHESHPDCDKPHDYRAHIKASPKGREMDVITRAVARWVRWEFRLWHWAAFVGRPHQRARVAP